VTFPNRRDGPPERRKEVSLEGVHKGAIPKTPHKELSIRENLFVSPIFAVV
jgi:hypothetical protein